MNFLPFFLYPYMKTSKKRSAQLLASENRIPKRV